MNIYAHVHIWSRVFYFAILTISEPKNRFTRFPSWNTKIYPMWKDGDPRYKDAWKGTNMLHVFIVSMYILFSFGKCCFRPCLCTFLVVSSLTGGRVSFNVGNDSPTLTGAKVTFTIDLEFPHNQKVQENGEVVWAEDCKVNGNAPPHTAETPASHF